MAPRNPTVAPNIYLCKGGTYGIRIRNGGKNERKGGFKTIASAQAALDHLNPKVAWDGQVRTADGKWIVPLTAVKAVWYTELPHCTEILECDRVPSDHGTATDDGRLWFLSREPKHQGQLCYYHFAESKAKAWLAKHNHSFTIDQLDEVGLTDPAGGFLNYRPKHTPATKKEDKDA